MIGLYNEFFRFPALDYHLSIGVAVAVGDRQPRGRGAGRAVGGAARGAHSAGRSDASGAAGAVSPQRRRARVAAIPHRRRRRGWCCATSNVSRSDRRSSVIGIAFAVAVLFVGLAFIDVMNVLIDEQFVMAHAPGRDGDLRRAAVAARDVRGRTSARRHGRRADPQRAGPPARRPSVAHARHHRAAGDAAPEPRRRTASGRVLSLPADGLVLSTMLGRILDVAPGDRCRSRCSKGRGPVRAGAGRRRWSTTASGSRPTCGSTRCARCCTKAASITGAAVTLDPAAIGRFYAAVKALPAIAGVALRAVTLQNFRDTMAENMNLQIFINVMFAGIIAFGVVYNSARVSLSERERELASLRVLGFTRARDLADSARRAGRAHARWRCRSAPPSATCWASSS